MIPSKRKKSAPTTPEEAQGGFSILDLSFSLGVGIHDAAYVALAKDLGLTMITADKKPLKKTAGLKFVERLR